MSKEHTAPAKAAMSYVPARVLAEMGVVMMLGGVKYGRLEWRAGEVSASAYYDATLRHLFAWWEGEDVDPETGLSHLCHAMAGLAVLRDAQVGATLRDDRPVAAEPFYASLNEAARSIGKRTSPKES